MRAEVPPSYPAASPSHDPHGLKHKSSKPLQVDRTVKRPYNRQKSKGPSSGKKKLSFTDEKKIMDHIKKKNEEFQMKVLKHRQKKQLSAFKEDDNNMNNLKVPNLPPTVSDINAEDNENSEVREVDENARESAFLNVLKMYSNNSIQETITIDDDDEDGTVTKMKSDFSLEKSHQSEKSNQSSEKNYNNANSEGIQKTGNVKEDEPKHVEQVSASIRYKSSLLENEPASIRYKSSLLGKESASISYKSSLLEKESAAISYKTNLLEKELEKQNKEVVTKQVDLASYSSEPKNSFDFRNNMSPNEFWIWSMKLKISQLTEQNNKNKYIASFQKQQSVENFQSSQSVTSYYYNVHGQNIFQKPYIQDNSGYTEYTPEKLLYNETEITKTSIDQLNTINHSNLAKNYTTNYENYLTRNDINKHEPYKGLTTTKAIKQTSPAQDESHKINKNLFDKTSYLEGESKGHADSQLVNVIDMNLPTKMKEVRSDEIDHLHSIKGREGMHLEAEQTITLQPECATENVVQAHIEIKYVNGDNLKSGSVQCGYQNMDIIDVDLEPENSPDVVIIEAEEWEADTNNGQVLEVKMGDAVTKTESKNMQRSDVCVGEARDTSSKQYANEEEYKQPEDKNHQEIFYDDVFISNVKTTMYQYCLLA